MTIELRCCCGASIKLATIGGVLPPPFDKETDTERALKLADEWKRQHAGCVEARRTLTTPAAPELRT